MTAPLLSLRTLTVRYAAAGGAVTALDGIDLELARGKALGLVGESGSGKSTVALAVMGLLPREARVEATAMQFDRIDLATLAEPARRALRGPRMALVFQDPFTTLNPSLRVGEQLGEGLVHHRGLDRAAALDIVIRLLEEVGITDPAAVARAYPHQLSGGMRQRALIASALAVEPDLLVLDEPTTALDVTIEAQILDLLEDLRRRRGLAMLFISHNLGVVRRICDDVAVLYAGRVVERGPADRLFARPTHPYAKGLVAAIPRLGRRVDHLASIPGRLPDLAAMPTGCAFADRCPFVEPACRTERQALAPVVAADPMSAEVACRRAAVVQDLPWPTTVGDQAAPVAPAPIAPTPTAPTPTAPTPTAPARDAGPPATAVMACRDLSRDFVRRRGFLGFGIEGGRLVRRIDRVSAVDGVTLSIAPGEVLGLVGESGSGKTTLGRTLLRLIEPGSGEIWLDGAEITRFSQRRLAPLRRAAQIAFQNPDSSLNPRRTVGEILARPLVRFGLASRAEASGRVARLLNLVRLPAGYAARYPHQMSGGEKQRVGIARALASEPRFLVCDEPVSALDVSVQAAIVNLLADLRDRLGVAYLFISHDIAVVGHLADRIAVMYRGRIVEIGPADHVLAPPHHPYTAALLSAVPTIDGEREGRIVLAGSPAASTAQEGCVFAARCPRRIGTMCDRERPPTRVFDDGHRIDCHLEPTALLG